jgi:hypothetical protein
MPEDRPQERAGQVHELPARVSVGDLLKISIQHPRALPRIIPSHSDHDTRTFIEHCDRKN